MKTHEAKLTIYRITPQCYNPCSFGSLDVALEEAKNLLSEMIAGEELKIEVMEMTQEEWAAVPEFGGW